MFSILFLFPYFYPGFMFLISLADSVSVSLSLFPSYLSPTSFLSFPKKSTAENSQDSAFADLLLQRAGKSPSKWLSNELISFRASSLVTVMCYPNVFCTSHRWCLQKKKKMGRPLKADRAYSQVHSLGNLLGKRLF